MVYDIISPVRMISSISHINRTHPLKKFKTLSSTRVTWESLVFSLLSLTRLMAPDKQMPLQIQFNETIFIERKRKRGANFCLILYFLEYYKDTYENFGGIIQLTYNTIFEHVYIVKVPKWQISFFIFSACRKIREFFLKIFRAQLNTIFFTHLSE